MHFCLIFMGPYQNSLRLKGSQTKTLKNISEDNDNYAYLCQLIVYKFICVD